MLHLDPKTCVGSRGLLVSEKRRWESPTGPSRSRAEAAACGLRACRQMRPRRAWGSGRVGLIDQEEVPGPKGQGRLTRLRKEALQGKTSRAWGVWLSRIPAASRKERCRGSVTITSRRPAGRYTCCHAVPQFSRKKNTHESDSRSLIFVFSCNWSVIRINSVKPWMAFKFQILTLILKYFAGTWIISRIIDLLFRFEIFTYCWSDHSVVSCQEVYYRSTYDLAIEKWFNMELFYNR